MPNRLLFQVRHSRDQQLHLVRIDPDFDAEDQHPRRGNHKDSPEQHAKVPACQRDASTAPGPTTGNTTPGTIRTPDAIPNDYQAYANLCAKPRSGVDAFTGQTFPDRQGTLLDELKFLRAYTNQYYLWYNEIPTDFKMADLPKSLR